MKFLHALKIFIFVIALTCVFSLTLWIILIIGGLFVSFGIPWGVIEIWGWEPKDRFALLIAPVFFSMLSAGGYFDGN